MREVYDENLVGEEGDIPEGPVEVYTEPIGLSEEPIEPPEESVDASTEPEAARFMRLRDGARGAVHFVRGKIAKLGVPGLMAWNGVKGVGAGVGGFYLSDGDVTDKLQSGLGAAGVAVIASQTFWVAMGMIGHKVVKRRK